MKKKSKSDSDFILANVLLAVIIFILSSFYLKIRKIDKILEKVIKIEEKLDEELVPSTRIKRKKNKKKNKDWRN